MVDEIQILLSNPALRYNHTNYNNIHAGVAGLEIAFEEGEYYTSKSRYLMDRIVRVGKSGDLQTRIHQHYNANNAGSAFRHHVGQALGNENDNEIVTNYFRKNISFMIIRTPDYEQLKGPLIATLYQSLGFGHSNNWLGINAGCNKLWQKNELNGPQLTNEQLLEIFSSVG